MLLNDFCWLNNKFECFADELFASNVFCGDALSIFKIVFLELCGLGYELLLLID